VKEDGRGKKEEGRGKREEGRGKREVFLVRGSSFASFLYSSLLNDARTIKKLLFSKSEMLPPNIPQHLLNPTHRSLRNLGMRIK
jgi:hypothetical protein